MSYTGRFKHFLFLTLLWSGTVLAEELFFSYKSASRSWTPFLDNLITFSLETEMRDGVEQQIIFMNRLGQGKQRVSKKMLRELTPGEKSMWVQYYDSMTSMPKTHGSPEERFSQSLAYLPPDKYISTVDISSLEGMAAYEGFRRAVLDKLDAGDGCSLSIEPTLTTPNLPIFLHDSAIKMNGACKTSYTKEEEAKFLETFKKIYLQTKNRFTVLDFFLSSSFATDGIEFETIEYSQNRNAIDWRSKLAEAEVCLGSTKSSVDQFHKGFVAKKVSTEQLAYIEKSFNSQRAIEAEQRTVVAAAVDAGEAKKQDLKDFDNRVVQTEEKRQAIETFLETKDDAPLKKIVVASDADIAETEVRRSVAISTLREKKPSFVVREKIIDSRGVASEYESTVGQYVRMGSPTSFTISQSDKKNYSTILDEKERVSQIASDFLVEGQRRGVDITEERALDMAERVDSSSSKTVHFDDIFGKVVDQNTEVSDYRDYAKESKDQFKNRYEVRKISEQLNAPGLEKNSPEVVALEQRLNFLQKQIKERNARVEEARRIAEKAKAERERNELQRIADQNINQDQAGHQRTKSQNRGKQPAVKSPSRQIRSSSQAAIRSSRDERVQQATGESSGHRKYADSPGSIASKSKKSQKTQISASHAEKNSKNRPSRIARNTEKGQASVERSSENGPTKGRSIASIESARKPTEKSNTKGRTVKPQKGEKPKVAVSTELLIRIASFSFKEWEELSAEEKQMYQEYFRKVFALLDLSKIDFDLKKLREKYVTIGGDKVFIDKAALLEIEDPAVFTAFLLNVLMENPTMTALYLRDGAKAQKLSFHHTTEQDMGFAIRAFSEGFEEISTTKNFERMMLLRVYSDEAKAVAKNTSNGEANGSQN